MVKSKRPVIIISAPIKGRTNLVTVVTLSTQKPEHVQNYHYKLPKQSLPQLGNFQNKDSWVKGDMIIQ